ncbi:MAG: MogA/MoaB family molybdenum cofactor biosynthesis protein [Fimbriimonadaceae bacterium]|nr:MogA/MoaB family molybdenum cofactor biosynthesis protein [Chthonomonadaceae bacterium]MCO5296708.1 MogA/MoaB family molybdenum cofactor biosynthesis protein [Fimbriimonadaceae bacterium]
MEARVGVVTVSDSRSAGRQEDQSGPAAVEALRAQGFCECETRLVPDEISAIQRAIAELCETCAAVFTTGGTGFSPRDVTPEATSTLLDRRADNLVELMRLRGLEHTPMSHLSRGIAGVRGATLVVNLPGSPKAVRQGLDALAPLLPDLLSALQGDGCGHGC